MNVEDKTIVKLIVDSIIHFTQQVGRPDLLGQIISQLRRNVQADQETAVVTSANQLTSEDKEKLTKIVRKKFAKSTPIDFFINESLVGGFTIQIGDLIIDHSAKGQLKRFTKQVV